MHMHRHIHIHILILIHIHSPFGDRLKTKAPRTKASPALESQNPNASTSLNEVCLVSPDFVRP
jgi:hypothetical protein